MGLPGQSLQAGPEDGNTVFIWPLFSSASFTAAGALLEGIFITRNVFSPTVPKASKRAD